MFGQIGRGTAVIFSFLVLLIVGLLVWAGDAATGGAVRKTVLGRLTSEGNGPRAGRSWILRTDRAGANGRPSGKSSGKSAKKPPPKAQPSIADPGSSCTIMGEVLDEEKRPIKGAKVTVRGPGTFNRSETTDAKGRYTLSKLPTGTFDIHAIHPDYVHLVRPAYSLIQHGQIARLDFILPLGVKISGTVKNEAGTLLQGVQVAARRKNLKALSDGEVYLDDSVYKTDKTDKKGAFTVKGVSLGTNVFEFRMRGYEMAVREVTVKAAKTQPSLNIVLRRTGTLAGTVLDHRGEAVSSAVVHLVRYKPIRGAAERMDKGKVTATTDRQGRFRFTKLYTEGFYDLLIDDSRFAPAVFPATPVGSTEVTCRLEPGGIIEGRAQFIDRPTTEAAVLIEAVTVVKGTTFTQAVKSNGAGAFVFNRLPYGKYALAVRSSGLVSEPKTNVPCERGKPTRGVLLDIYEAGVVRGRVADGRDDSPVPGATVVLEAGYGLFSPRKKTFQTRTDRYGGFAFFQVPAGTHVARASAPGFLKTVSDASQVSFSLEPGERKSDVALLLDRGGIVEGFVIDPAGRAVPEADVQVFSPSTVYEKIDDRAFKSQSDTSGYFMISGIPLGERTQLYASARKPGFAKGRSPLIELTMRHPEAITQVLLTPGGTITGKVTDQKDLPVGGAVVRFDSTEFPGDPTVSYSTTRSAADGSYLLPHITPGTGRISVTRSGYVKQERSLTVKEETPTRVNFKLEAGGQISGTVAALNGRPIAGATVTAKGVTRTSRGTDTAITDRDGRFTLSNLSEGIFSLQARFKLPTSDGEQSYIFVNPEVATGTGEAAIDCDVGNLLTGLVVDEDGKGIGNFTLSLRSRDDIPQQFTFDLNRKVSGSRGSFLVEKIPRGIYKMSITASGYASHVDDNVAVGPTPRTDLPRIVLRSAGGVRGELYSSSTKRPVTGVRVRLLDPDAPTILTARELAPSATSNAQGVFQITTAMAGSYDVEFTHPSYLPYTVAGVSVSKDRVTDLGRIELEAGGAIRGTVTDGEGNPVPGMLMSVSGISKTVRTDAAGNYLFQGIQEGRWNVIARGRVHNRSVYIWQPAVVTADEAEPVDFHISLDADLSGMVVVPGGDGVVKSGKVRIHPFDEEGIVLSSVYYEASVSSSDGTFSIREVPPGVYFLQAAGKGPTNAPFTTWKLLNLSSGHNDVQIRIGGGMLKGEIRETSTGKVAKQVDLQLRPLFDSVRLPAAIYDALCPTGKTNNNGRFSLPHLNGGSWQLMFRPRGGSWYAQPPFTLGEGQVVEDYNFLIP